MHKTAKGLLGQNIAKKFLEEKGYLTLLENFRTRFSEIDLVCQKDNCLIFVEVKTRYSGEFGEPEEAVTPYKIGSISKAAEFFKLKYPNSPESMQIDVIAIKLTNANGILSLNHLKNVTG